MGRKRTPIEIGLHRTNCEALSKEKRCYLAGKMTGLPAFNFPAFHAAAANLREMGLTVINPAENFGGDTTLPYETYLEKALEQVASCGAIIRLPGWENSKGVARECELARSLHIPIYDYETVLGMKL